jgi:hypothetical protein
LAHIFGKSDLDFSFETIIMLLIYEDFLTFLSIFGAGPKIDKKSANTSKKRRHLPMAAVLLER